MSDRYWVGGTASWDATAGTKWATTSGGAGGAAVPTSSDDVYFDAASGTVTITQTGTGNCNNLTLTGFTGTFAGNGTLNIYGSMTLASTATYTRTGSLTFLATTTGKTIDFGGYTGSFNVNSTWSGVGGGWTLLSNVNFTNAFSHTAGTLDLSTFTFSVGTNTWSSSGSTTRSLSGSAGSKIICGNMNLSGSNATYSTSSIDIESTSSGTLSMNSTTWDSFTITSSSNVVLSAVTCASFTFNGGSSTATRLSLSGNLTVSGTATLSGFSATAPLFVGSNDDLTQRTFSAATVTTTNTYFENISAAGAASWDFSAQTDIGDCGRNTGITFPAPITCYWSGGTANWDASSRWFTATGGGGSAARMPLPQDTARFDANSFASSGQTVILNKLYYPTINCSGVTNSPTFAAAAACKFYGSFTQSSGMTWTGAGVFTFYGHTTHTITSAGVTHARNFSFICPDGSYTLTDALTLGSSNVITYSAGTFNDGGFTITCARIDGNNSNTRSLTFTGTHYFLGNNATMLNFTITTGLTLSASSSTFNLTYSGASGTRTIVAGTVTLGNLNVSAGTDTFSFGTSAITYNNIDLTGFNGVVAGSNNQTVLGNLTLGNHSSWTSSHTFVFARTSGTSTFFGNNKTISSGITASGSGGTASLTGGLTSTSAITVSGATFSLASNAVFSGNVTVTSGTLITNGYGLTCAQFLGTGTSVRTINITDSTITVTGTSTCVNFTTTTNLTFVSTGSTLILNNATASLKQLAMGGTTWGDITFTGLGTGTFQFATSSCTMKKFSILSAPKTVEFASGQTYTMENFVAEGSSGNLITLSPTSTTNYNFVYTGPGNTDNDYLSISKSTATPSTLTWYAGSHSTDGGGNSGWIFIDAPVVSNDDLSFGRKQSFYIYSGG